MLKLTTIMLNTDNLKQLIAFYSQVFDKDPDWQEGDYAGFDTGGTYLLLGYHSKIQGPNPNSDRILFNLETNNVKGEFNRLKSLVKVIAEPYEIDMSGDHGTIATLADPDGNYFQLTTPGTRTQVSRSSVDSLE